MPTQTELANRAFLNEVSQIPGVVSVETSGGTTLSEQSIFVTVPSLRSEVSGQVFELESRVFCNFPDARLDVHVIGLKERGLDASDPIPPLLTKTSSFQRFIRNGKVM
jgi:hypothetical protein